MKTEVIMYGGRSAFDSAIRLDRREACASHGLRKSCRSAISPNTAMIYTTALGDRLTKALEIAKAANVPLMLDDAAGIPPIENLRKYADMKIDLFCFSGGKGMSRSAVLRNPAGT